MVIKRYDVGLGLKAPILLISDLHIGPNFDSSRLVKLLKIINSFDAAYLFIAGDVFDAIGWTKRDDVYLGLLRDWLAKINQGVRVVIGVGNHDFDRRDQIPFEQLMSLSRPNVRVLVNEQTTIGEIEVVSLDYGAPYYKLPKSEAYQLAEALFKKFRFKSDKPHVLLVHPPGAFNSPTVRDTGLFKGADLILSGHIHNGVLPDFLTTGAGNRGFLSPRRLLLPRLARGRVDYPDNTLIISGGVSKVSFINNRLINFFYKPEIAVIY